MIETLAEKKNTSTSSHRIESLQTMTPAYGNTTCPHQYNILIHNTYPHTVCKKTHAAAQAHISTHRHAGKTHTHTRARHAHARTV